MNYLALLLALISLTAAIEAAPSETKWKCDKADDDKIDKLVADAIVIGTSENFPTDKKAMKRFCNTRMKTLTTFESYKEACTDGQLKQTISVFVFSLKNLLNTHCRSLEAKRTKQLLAAGSCLNDANKEITKCYNVGKQLLTIGMKIEDNKKRLGQLCCMYQQFLVCTREKAAAIKSCPEKHVTTLINFVKQGFDNTINLICGDFTADTDKCDNFAFIRKGKGVQEQYHSFITPAIKIVSSL